MGGGDLEMAEKTHYLCSLIAMLGFLVYCGVALVSGRVSLDLKTAIGVLVVVK